MEGSTLINSSLSQFQFNQVLIFGGAEYNLSKNNGKINNIMFISLLIYEL